MLTTATLFMGNTFSNLYLYVVDRGCDLLYSRAPQGCRMTLQSFAECVLK